MDRLPVKELLRRFGKAKARRENWRSAWRDAYRLTMPARDIIDNPTPGQQKGFDVYDSTGMNEVSHFANRIQSTLFPPFQDFVKLEPGPSIQPGARDQAAKILQDATKKFHSAIHHSNFSTAINEFILELGVGTGLMLFQEGTDWDPFVFDAVPTPLVAVEPGPRGSIGGFFREHRVALGNIEHEWPDAKLPEALAGDARKEPDREELCIEYCWADWKAMRWYCEVIIEKGEHRLFDKPRVYEDMGPWIYSRWTKAANESYGRGPILFGLPDIRTTNKVVELILKNASLAVSGVYTGVDDGVLNPNTARIIPGAIIPVAANAGARGPSLQPLERPGNFDVAQLVLQDMRENIRRMLYNKGLPDQLGPVRSATEIVERMRELSVDIGAAFGRIQKELVTPLVLRGLQILSRKGIISYPFRIDGNTVKVVVTSPLAQQQNLERVQTVNQWFQMMASIGGPELAMYTAKVEEAGVWIGRQLGVDEELIREEGERADVEQMIQAMLQRAMQQQQPQQAA